MRVDGVDSQHEEHVKILEALGSNLKSEVARGLRLLDTCVTNIAQAKWILSNVDECLSGFSKGCPVCGTLPERHVAKTVGKEIKTKSNANSPDSNQNQFKRSTEPDRVVITNKPLKSSAFQSLRKPSSSPPPRPKPPTTNAAPVHRIGPRSKTRPAEPSAAVPVPAEVIVEDPPIPPKPKIIDITTPPRKLPKIFSVVVAQTVVQVELTDIKPYLRGRTTKVDLSKLNGFVSPTKPIPSDLKFKPEVIKVRSQATKKAVQGPGPASKRFIESLKKTESVSKPNILDSSSSDGDKPVIVKPTPRPTPAPVAAPAPPPAVSSKKNASDSGSDYDYNFASTTNTNNTKSLKTNKSKIGSQVTLSKRPRPQSTDSDEDYDYKKKKGTKSIFKKKVSSSSSTSDDSDSDAYERKKKKKVKRKDSTTDKEKDKASSSKKEAKTGSGSRSSSIVTSRMTVALDPSHPSSSKILNSLKSKSDSKIRRDSGSTTGSYAKSDTSSKDKARHKPETKEVPAKSKVQSADPVPESTVKPIEPTVAPVPPKPAAYRPGPASRKKLAQPPVSAAAEASTSKPTEPTSKPDAVSEPKTVNVAETADKSETASTNGEKTATTTVQGNSASKADPFTLLKQSIKASHSKAPEGPAKDKPVAAPVISSLMSSLDLKAKAQLLAKLTQMSSKKQGPPVSKPTTETPVQASLKALSALVKPQKLKAPPAAPLPAPVDLDTEDDRGIELGDDVIGRCIGDIEDTGAGGDVPDNTGDADADAGSIDQTDSEPRISITFQDCLSPTPTTLYSGNDDAAEPSPEPDSSSTTTVEKIQHLLLKFALEPIDDAALLHSQDKLNQLFGFGLHSNSAEFETFRGDLQDGVWYLVNGKSLGKAVCSDTVSLFEWEAVSEEDLTRILRELEGYTASCVR